MVAGFFTQVTGCGSLLTMGIQSQNLTDYLGSYLLMAGGAGLIIIGIILAIKLYIKEKREQAREAAADLNRQIKETTQNARSSQQRNAPVQYRPQFVTTAEMDKTVVDYQINNDETALMDKNLHETSILAGSSLPSVKTPSADQDETAYLLDGGKR